jgi:glutaredoxin
MEKNKLFIVGGVSILVIAGFVFWGAKQPSTGIAPTGQIIYYYGETCPHCQNVSKFLDENKVAEKVSFSKKEVYSNKDNAAELQSRAKECGINSGSIGIPFVYAQGKCFVGEPDVMDFFKKEAGIQ